MIIHKLACSGLALLLLQTVGWSATYTKITVEADRVNLRARPLVESEVVGQVNYGETLFARTFQEMWVEIRPPDNIDLWVHRDFIEFDEVIVKTLNIRSGPGINYNVVGRFQREDRVNVRGEFGDWLKIAPPETASLWVSRDYVEVMALPARIKRAFNPREPKLRERPSREIKPTPIAHRKTVTPVPAARTVPAPPPPSDLKLIPLDGQGQRVEYTGVLAKAGYLFGRLSRYRLVHLRGNVTKTLCYVRGNEDRLKELLGKEVRISGREYWAQGNKSPVVMVEEIGPGGRRPIRKPE